MFGAIAGDIIGSVHEFIGTKTKDFPLFVPGSKFTDDTVLTVAVADWILSGRDLVDVLHAYTRDYPNCSYGLRYRRWAFSGSREPYGSYGNGSAMRVSPVGFAFDTIDAVMRGAEQSAAVTHNDPEGIRGAQAVAAAIFYARHSRDKADVRRQLEAQFGYDLSTTLDEIRPDYRFSESCMETVPQALIAFLESTSYEDAVRNAISLGGDADTLACITGSIAEAFYGGVPEEIVSSSKELLDDRLATVVNEFRERFRLA